ncbi:1,4-dihydroxy-6-naphtoate synthase [compost metagenome]
MYKHIGLYVNKYSIELGPEGRKAINVLFEMATQKGLIPAITKNIYLTGPGF